MWRGWSMQPGIGVAAAGCRLELTGTYAALNGKAMTDAEGAAFEILLNSPDDVTVLARPPWWTPRRLAMAIGTLMVLLMSVMVWVRQLHRKVEQRTVQLAVQIQKREQVEHQNVLEQERARVARDLHDLLGSGLTEISMLSVRAGEASAAADRQLRLQVHQYEDLISQATRDQKKLQQEISVYQGRVALSPAIEEQYKELARDYDNTQKNYQDLLADQRSPTLHSRWSSSRKANKCIC